nr:MAG TPA: hypothetical protein [Caudoviricetes sp.]
MKFVFWLKPGERLKLHGQIEKRWLLQTVHKW